jgi:hypothetical protein
MVPQDTDFGSSSGLGGGGLSVINGKQYVLYSRVCGSKVQYAWVPLVRDPAELARLAYDEMVRKLPKPKVTFAPPATDGVVQVGTWFWTDPATWRPVTATASIPGLSATVTATPTTLAFDLGDGKYGTGKVTCTGPGQAWTPADGDEAVSPCQYTYRHSSSMSRTGAWKATVSIGWTVAFRASNGASRALDALTTSRSYNLQVGEIQALVVDG